MGSINKEDFKRVWPRCFVIFMGVIELLSVIVLLVTEFGNVAANFWTTNVFAGAWCGLIVMIHFFALFVAGCCSPSPSAAFRAVIITIVALLACGTLIGFDAYFIAKPTTCILTSSCSSNAASTTIFSYYFRQSFFTAFNSLSAFKSYSQDQTKFLFQTIQLGVGSLCFVLCLIYLIVYYVSRSRAAKQVGPSGGHADYPAPRPSYPARGDYYPPPAARYDNRPSYNGPQGPYNNRRY